jgi:hypothetical protein
LKDEVPTLPAPGILLAPHPKNVLFRSFSKKDRASPPSKKSHTLNNSFSQSNSGPSSQTKITSNPNIHYEFQEGEVMDGYKILRQLGEGTFGRVV